jgi:restriction system protein
LLDRQSGIDSIRELTWREFERLVAEAYRRRGYLAEAVGTGSGDGGVDIRLTGPGETTLVQCKQWRAYTVGVTTVRELLGVVTAEKATKGIVVTSGRYTNAARRFAQQSGKIELVDGPALAVLVREVQGAGQTPLVQQPPVQIPESPPQCPSCGSDMVLRVARKGTNAGSQFWGCRKYPACRGTRPHATNSVTSDSTIGTTGSSR